MEMIIGKINTSKTKELINRFIGDTNSCLIYHKDGLDDILNKIYKSGARPTDIIKNNHIIRHRFESVDELTKFMLNTPYKTYYIDEMSIASESTSDYLKYIEWYSGKKVVFTYTDSSIECMRKVKI